MSKTIKTKELKDIENLAKLIKKADEPVFVKNDTSNKNELVIMSLEVYNQLFYDLIVAQCKK